jgi:hypothetical protein
LRRSQRLQERQLLERLRDRDKDIQVKSRDRAAYIDPTPDSSKPEGTERSNGHSQQDERHHSDRACRTQDKRRQQKPVTLVKIVVARNNAVQPPNNLSTNRPYKTTTPERIPIKLKTTWSWGMILVSLQYDPVFAIRPALKSDFQKR